MSYEDVKRWRKANKMRMIESFGSECGICGYNKCHGALEFHHVNPDEKDYNPSRSGMSWERTVTELRKCVLLCANCHREVHNGVAEVPSDIRRFDESYCNKAHKEAEVDECPVCGNTKLKRLKTCSKKCAGKRKSKVDWDSIDLQKLLNEHGSYMRVGDVLGISDAAVRKRAIKLNLVG